jgi:predicted short-subunit dehydrogenase-like oxidoreductase (DUF2520 family)
MLRVNIIGTGRVGRTFMALLREQRTVELCDVTSGHPESARSAVVAAGFGRAVSTMEEMCPADLWILAVPDDRIAAVACELAASQDAMMQGAGGDCPVAVHCSGFLSSEELLPLRDLGWAIASCHPVLSFADPEIARRRFPGTYCGIEGDEVAVRLIGSLIAGIGGMPFSVSTEKKALYHAGAVFANNFTVVLQVMALEAWAEAGVDEEVARALGSTLLRSTYENVESLGIAAALTGPAARGDQNTLHRQERVVAEWHRDAAGVYRLMSSLAQRLKTTGKC